MKHCLTEYNSNSFKIIIFTMNKVHRELFKTLKIPINPYLICPQTLPLFSYLLLFTPFSLCFCHSGLFTSVVHGPSSGLLHVLFLSLHIALPWPHTCPDHPRTCFKCFLKYHLLQKASHSTLYNIAICLNISHFTAHFIFLLIIYIL